MKTANRRRADRPGREPGAAAGDQARVCVCIAETSCRAALEALEGLTLAEIRLDALRPTRAQLREIFSRPCTTIATCRPGTIGDGTRKALLIAAVEAGAAMVDVEIDSPAAHRRAVVAAARRRGCRVIISHHDFGGTPPRPALERIVGRCFAAGAEIAKVACTTRTRQDCCRLVGLLDSRRDVVVAGMGRFGPRARVAAWLCGAPFVYVAVAKGRETAAGQIDAGTFGRISRVLDRALP